MCRFLFLFSFVFGQQYIDGIAAIVENKVILKSELVQMVNMVSIQKKISPQDPGFLELQKEVLSSMIDQKILLEMAALDSVFVDEKQVDQSLEQQVQMIISQSGGKKEAEKALGQTIKSFKNDFWYDMQDKLVSETYQQQLMNKVSVNKGDILSFFNIYQDSLPILPLQVKLKHLLIKPKASKEKKDLIIKTLNKIKEEIEKGSDFGELAKKHSMDPGTKNKGGELGWVKKGSLVKEFETEAFTIPLGKTSNPIRTEFGYHLIKTIDRAGDKALVKHILLIPELTEKDREQYFNKSLLIKDSSSTITLFEGFIKKYSEDEQTSKLKGDLGWINPETYPVKEIGMSIKYLKKNECSNPINSEFGFHLLWIEEVKKSGKPTLKNNWFELETMALNEKKSNWYSNWLTNAKENFFIKIYN
tara:strand:+ start:5486 stop:6736 length:1251 start_codon:yes stop_codon:yes gene_type:complete